MAKDKPVYKSKGKMGGLLVALSGIALAVGQYLQGSLSVDVLISTVVPLIGTGLGIYGIRAKL